MYCCYSSPMRAGRLLSLLMLLQARGRMSAPALAAELQVSVRTVLRDIDHLSIAGVPVWAERGRDGGFRLREGWSTELTGLTESEAQALLLAGLPSAATELGLGSASTSARLKLLAAVPDALREDAERVGSRLHIDPVDWYRRAAPPACLQTVAHAVWRQRVLSMRYDSWTGLRDRTVKPLGLVLKAGVWYLVALPPDGKQARTYRLSNIRELQLAKATFAYPRKFRLVEFWRDATSRFESEIYRDAALLRANARGLKKLGEMSAAVNEAALRTATPEAGGGEWQRVRVPIESIDHACGQFLAAGIDIEVLEPRALRDRMREVASALHGVYAAAKS
ncbi:helix-turn-helix transcriptional regulator [Arenimonas sp.]|uniref:helix-turn-helix transcriptional regulator n=1 Tax=Arenimonas sp. TaxID=1872635 RepID=UPI0039E69D00